MDPNHGSTTSLLGSANSNCRNRIHSVSALLAMVRALRVARASVVGVLSVRSRAARWVNPDQNSGPLSLPTERAKTPALAQAAPSPRQVGLAC